MKLIPMILSVSASLLTLGCASVGTQFTKMSEPESGDRARLRVHANMLVKGIPNSSCIDWGKEGAGTIFGGILGSSGYRGRSLGMPNPDGIKGSSGEFYATANQPMVLVLLNTPESRMRCSVSARFTPESGKDYQVNLKTARKGAMTSVCHIEVKEYSTAGWKPVLIQEPRSCD